MINRNSLFSDETVDYKTPYEPQVGDTVTVRLRTLMGDILHAVVVINGVKHSMVKTHYDGTFDYYAYSFVCPRNTVSYYFILTDDSDKVCYNRLGAVENSQVRYEFSFKPGFHVPEWALGTVYYQIFTDRFCNGDKTNDVTDNEYYYLGGHVKNIWDWDKTPDENLDVRYFYGGDLQGVRQKLDYLQSLGVETIYFNPLFVSPSNHKYDTQDYDHIDPHLAVIEEDTVHAMAHWEKDNSFAQRYITRVTSQTNLDKSNAYFADLVKEIHARGMRVIIDGVFNHCGSFNKWMDREGIYLGRKGFKKGAYQSVKSPYRNYFQFDKNGEYEGWWNLATLPKLNYEGSEQLTEYILSTGKKWVSEPYNVDGWRLDVAADLGHSPAFNHSFWRRFRKSVRSANGEALILSEHYGSPVEWFRGDEWDTVMNYDAFMEPVTWFLTGMEKHSDAFDASKLGDGNLFFMSIFEKMAMFPRPSLDSALNQLSNHDHSRFLTRTNMTVGRLNSKGPSAAGQGVDKRLFKLATLIQMTWPGSPGIYYGDEAGQVGWTDPDCRRTYPWGHEDRELIEYTRAAVDLRKKIPCLKMGSLKDLDRGRGYIAYARFNREGCAVVIINQSEEQLTLSIPVWEAGMSQTTSMQCVFSTEPNATGEEGRVRYGRLFVALPPRSGCVYTGKFDREYKRVIPDNAEGEREIASLQDVRLPL